MSGGRGDQLRALVISGLGSGYAPFASGSWGSLVAVILFGIGWLAAAAIALPRWAIEAGLAVATLGACFFSVVWGEWAIARFASKDPKKFTLDEFAGQWVALLAMPIVLDGSLWRLALVVGGQFFLFRLFDVTKPPPARQLERLPAGWGVLCDDIAAGVYANAVGQLLWRVTPLAAWFGAAA